MQYLTLTKSLKKLHTLKKLKYSQSLFDQSSFESLKISLSRQLAVIWPNPVQSMQFLQQIQSNPTHGWIQSVSNSATSQRQINCFNLWWMKSLRRYWVKCYHVIVQEILIASVMTQLIVSLWPSLPRDVMVTTIFIARQHTVARYWYSMSVRLSVGPSVRPSVRDVPQY